MVVRIIELNNHVLDDDHEQDYMPTATAATIVVEVTSEKRRGEKLW